MEEVDPKLYKDILERALVIRRVRLRQALEKRGIEMGEVKLDIRGSILDIGLRRVIEEVGIERVIDEVGLQRVIEEIGADRIRSELEKYEQRKNGE